MDVVIENYNELPKALGLNPESEGLFVGRRDGFPIGLKFIGSADAMLLLFQIRHWLTAAATQLKKLTYDQEIAELIDKKGIEIEFADQLIWVTFPNVRLDAVGAVPRRVDSILGTLKAAELVGNPELCHYCQKEKVVDLSVSEGKVAQICPACFNARMKNYTAALPAPGRDAVPIFLMTPFAAIVGALLWVGCWIIYTLILDRVDSGAIGIPRLIFVAFILFLGIPAGLPVGWTIRQNRRRGNVASASAALLFASLTVLLGEVLYLAWLIWRWYGVFSLSTALKVLPAYYGGNDPFFLAMKLMAALTCVILAFEMAKPAKQKLKL